MSTTLTTVTTLHATGLPPGKAFESTFHFVDADGHGVTTGQSDTANDFVDHDGSATVVMRTRRITGGKAGRVDAWFREADGNANGPPLVDSHGNPCKVTGVAIP